MRSPARPPRWPPAGSRLRRGSRASSAAIAIPAGIRDSRTCRASRHFSRREARFPDGSGPFCFGSSLLTLFGACGHRAATLHAQRRSLTTCREAAPVLAGREPCKNCGCSSMGRARPRHGRGHGFEPRLPLHFRVCPCTTRHARAEGTAVRGCARGRAPCAARAPGRLADPSRLDTAESGICRVRLAGQGCRAFTPATRVRLPYTTPDQKPCALTRRAETGRKDRAAPDPVTGIIPSAPLAQRTRAPVYEAGGRTFESCAGRHTRVASRAGYCSCL